MKFRTGDRVKVVKGSLKGQVYLVRGLLRTKSRLLLNESRTFSTRRMRRRGLKSYSLVSVSSANVRHVDSGNSVTSVLRGTFMGCKMRLYKSTGLPARGDALAVIASRRRFVLRGNVGNGS